MKMKIIILLFTIVVAATAKAGHDEPPPNHSSGVQIAKVGYGGLMVDDQYLNTRDREDLKRTVDIRDILPIVRRRRILVVYLVKAKRTISYEQLILWELCHNLIINYDNVNVTVDFEKIRNMVLDEDKVSCKRTFEISTSICDLFSEERKHYEYFEDTLLLQDALANNLEHVYNDFIEFVTKRKLGSGRPLLDEQQVSHTDKEDLKRTVNIRDILPLVTRRRILVMYLWKAKRYILYEQLILWESCHIFLTNYDSVNETVEYQKIRNMVLDEDNISCKRTLKIPSCICDLFTVERKRLNYFKNVVLLQDALTSNLQQAYNDFIQYLTKRKVETGHPVFNDQHVSKKNRKDIRLTVNIKDVLPIVTRRRVLVMYLWKAKRATSYEQLLLWESCHIFLTNYDSVNATFEYEKIRNMVLDEDNMSCKKKFEIPGHVCHLFSVERKSYEYKDDIKLLQYALANNLEHVYHGFMEFVTKRKLGSWRPLVDNLQVSRSDGEDIKRTENIRDILPIVNRRRILVLYLWRAKRVTSYEQFRVWELCNSFLTNYDSVNETAEYQKIRNMVLDEDKMSCKKTLEIPTSICDLFSEERKHYNYFEDTLLLQDALANNLQRVYKRFLKFVMNRTRNT